MRIRVGIRRVGAGVPGVQPYQHELPPQQQQRQRQPPLRGGGGAAAGDRKTQGRGARRAGEVRPLAKHQRRRHQSAWLAAVGDFGRARRLGPSKRSLSNWLPEERNLPLAPFRRSSEAAVPLYL
eukprot:3627936-Pyramimonas_sp.AAC.1